MEDKAFQARSLLQPTVSQECVLQMDSVNSIDSTPPSSSSGPTLQAAEQKPEGKRVDEVEVCYPFHQTDHHTTVEVDLLKSYMKPNNTTTKEEQDDHQLTARLDDLLESSNEKPTMGRRFSMYGDNIRDPSEVNKNIDRYTFYSAALGSLKSRSFRQLLNTQYPGNEKEVKTVAELLIETTGWWVDIFAPTNEEMRNISKIFRIHPLTTEDIQAQESREKCEIFQNYMFISFRSFNHDFHSPDYLEAVSFYIIIFKDGVLTFRFQDLPHPANVRRRIHQLKDFIHVTPEWINYALIDNITDSFAPLIQHTELEVDSIDDLVLVLNGSEQNDMLRRIGSCRKTVMQLVRLLGPKADVVRSLIKRYDDKAKETSYNTLKLRESHSMANLNAATNNTNAVVHEQEQDESKLQHEVTLYLGDIQDHILTMLQNVTHYDLILGRAHRNYIGQISIELSQAGNTTNEVINRLTFFATIIVPLNLIGGLFGMNVYVPGQDKKDLVWFYWIVMGMLIYVVVMVAIGKRTGFL
ncbi:hypothetical protein BD560DRAFT_27126 [Blakeslea trispora]|nr:hypothetical protein BD560DRAFT_27126 [Blakeslea trispora]